MVLAALSISSARSSLRPLRGAFAGILLVACTGWTREIVHFKNGFSLEAERHLSRGNTVEVFSGSGSLEFAATEIGTIELLPAPQIVISAALAPLASLSPALLLSQAALAQGVDEDLVHSVACIESGFKQASISNKGAIGLMQLMPATAKALGVDPNRMDGNARGGVLYLRSLLVRYRGDSALALAAYNAGPGAVRKFNGVPPYLETRKYVVSVLKEYNHQLALRQAAKKMPSKPISTD